MLDIHRVVILHEGPWWQQAIDYRLSYVALWDVLRCVDILLAAFIVVWCLKHMRRGTARVEVNRWLFFLLFGVVSFLQEADQLGQPLLVWRLPAFLVLGALAIRINRQRDA